MAENPYANKVEFGDDVVMDISDTTAEAADVAEGKVFYAKSGARTVGTAAGGGDCTVLTYGVSTYAEVAAATLPIFVEMNDGETGHYIDNKLEGDDVWWLNGDGYSFSVASDNSWYSSYSAPYMQKVSSPTAGNLLTTDAHGQAVDSGKKPADFTTVTQVETLIADELAHFDHLDYEIVQALPATGEAGVRYLVKHPTEAAYEEYIYVDGQWYDIGATDELDLSDYYTKLEADALLADKVDTDAQATESVLGLIKLNSAQAIGVNASGQLTVGGRLGQFPTTTGIYAAADRDPRAVGNSSFLITDAMGMSLDTNRAFALVSGYGVTCKSAAAGATQYRVKNTYANRLKCKMAEGGYASINEATSKVERIVPVVSVTINGNPYTPDSSADSSAAADDIIITTESTLNPDGAMTNIRLFGVMKSYSSAHIGNGVASLGGGRHLLVGGGITKVGNSNDDCLVGSDIYASGNGNACFGRLHIAAKNRGLLAGTGHDTTNAKGEGVAAVGVYSLIDGSTLFAVGNGTSHTARSNAFEVTSDGGIVLKSPDASRWKITVDNSGNLTTTKL